MSQFISKSIKSASGSKLLKEQRQAQGLDLREIAKRLKINPEYLEAIEADRLDLIPEGLYSKSFIERYARFLGLEAESVLATWDQELGVGEVDPFSKKIIPRRQFIRFPKLVKTLLIILALVICGLYLMFYFRNLVMPPKLELIYPETNLSLTTNQLTVSGIVAGEAELRINGELILSDHDGYFEKEINLKKGLNNITIKAKKKYSREQVLNRQILVE